MGSCEPGASIDRSFSSEMFFPLAAVPSWRLGWSLQAVNVPLVVRGKQKKEGNRKKKLDYN